MQVPPLDARGELRADLLSQQRRDLPAEEAGDLLRFDAPHRLPDELFVERAQGGGGTERQVGGVFHLHQAPVVGLSEHVGHRAAPFGIAIQDAVQPIGRQAIGQFLGSHPVVDPCEGVVGHGVADALGGQAPRQPTVAVAVELQTERRPGRDPQVDQPEPGIYEVEIIVQALATVRPDEGPVRVLVVPGLIGIAGFHRRDDVDQPGMIAALLDDPSDHVLFDGRCSC